MHGEEDDAVAVGEPVAAGAELPRGAKPSLARIEPSTGKPLKAVLAASTRMIAGHRDDEVEARREVVEDRRRRSGRSPCAGRSRPAAARRRPWQPVEVVRVDVLAGPSGGQHDDAQHHRDRDQRRAAAAWSRRSGSSACGTPARRWRSPRRRSAPHSRTRTPAPAGRSAPTLVELVLVAGRRRDGEVARSRRRAGRRSGRAAGP